MRPALDMPQLQLELEASVRAHNETKIELMKAKRVLGEQIDEVTACGLEIAKLKEWIRKISG